MNVNTLLGNIQPQWHEAFLRFIDTGEADDAFLEYLNKDNDAQKVVELAFNAQAEAIQGLAKELKNPSSQSEISVDSASSLSADIEEAMMGVLELPPNQRDEVVRAVASNLTSSLQPKRQREVEAFVDSFRESIGQRVAKV